jgi:hypothetical protein
LVFQELNLSYLQAWGDEWQERAPRRLVVEYSLRSVREAGSAPERVLVISRVLPDSVNLGYQDLGSTIVSRVNGRDVHTLDALREALRKPQRGFHVIDLLPGGGRQRLVFSADEISDANRRIAERFDVPPPGASADGR